MLTLVAILIYILGEMAFSEYAPSGSTNWSIFYFVVNYLSLILICIDKFINSFSKIIRHLSLLCIAFFTAVSVQFLILINKPYEQYLESVNDTTIDTIKYLFFTILIVIISLNSYKKWAKQRVK